MNYIWIDDHTILSRCSREGTPLIKDSFLVLFFDNGIAHYDACGHDGTGCGGFIHSPMLEDLLGQLAAEEEETGVWDDNARTLIGECIFDTQQVKNAGWEVNEGNHLVCVRLEDGTIQQIKKVYDFIRESKKLAIYAGEATGFDIHPSNVYQQGQWVLVKDDYDEIDCYPVGVNPFKGLWEAWSCIPLEKSPWGTNDPAVVASALAVLDKEWAAYCEEYS